MRLLLLAISLAALAAVPGPGWTPPPASLTSSSDSAQEKPATLPLIERYGLLRLNIAPTGARTILDGQYLDTDVWLISMKPGVHSLAVQKDGYKLYEKHFEISHGDRLTFDIQLEEEEDPSRLPRLSQE